MRGQYLLHLGAPRGADEVPEPVIGRHVRDHLLPRDGEHKPVVVGDGQLGKSQVSRYLNGTINIFNIALPRCLLIL